MSKLSYMRSYYPIRSTTPDVAKGNYLIGKFTFFGRIIFFSWGFLKILKFNFASKLKKTLLVFAKWDLE